MWSSWWLAILVIVLGAGVIAGVVMLVRRPKAAKSAVTPEGRHARLFDAVQSWIAQGWSVEREENEEAVLAKGAQRMLVAVDAEGRVSTNALADAPAR